jgi:hypothetical protein
MTDAPAASAPTYRGWVKLRTHITPRSQPWESVDFRAAFARLQHEGHATGIAYAATAVISPISHDATLLIDAAERAQLWVNGVLVYQLDGFDSHEAETSRAPIRLQRGRNLIFVKACDGWTGWGVRVAIDGPCELAEVPLDVTGDTGAPPMAG